MCQVLVKPIQQILSYRSKVAVVNYAVKNQGSEPQLFRARPIRVTHSALGVHTVLALDFTDYSELVE